MHRDNVTPGKRALDIVAALGALGVLGPVVGLAAVAVAMEDGGSPWFRQERVGQGGLPFQILKLRTMRDGVVTRTGRWLRGTGIDEVPQFLHVLRGEMSVVGPRPLLASDLERLGWRDDAARLAQRPGITGVAQVLADGAGESTRAWEAWYQERAGLPVDLGLIAASFAMNVVGKRRVRDVLRRLRPG